MSTRKLRKRGNEYRILLLEYWVPLVVWLTAIYFFSTDAFSSGETSRIIAPLLKYFFPRLSSSDIEFWHGIVRKFAHIAEYFVLAIFTYRSLKYDEPDLIKAKIVTILFILAAACIDEFHQFLTISRGASLVDVGYDCLGAVWALWLTTVVEGRLAVRHRFFYEFRRLHPRSVL